MSKQLEREVTIYGLVDPRTSMLRYVGQTRRSPRTRLRQHIGSARKSTTLHASAWIAGLLKEDLEPEIIEIERHAAFDAADAAEQFWIEYFRFVGADLVNRSIGGRSNRGWHHTEAQKEKWRRGRCGENAPRYGDHKSAAERKNISIALKAVWKRQAHPHLGKKRPPEIVAKVLETKSRNPYRQTEKSRQKHRDAALRMWANPEHREKMRGKSAGSRNGNFGKPMLPHVKASIKANVRRGFTLSEETKAKISKAAKGRAVYRKGRPHLPETIAKMKAAQKLRFQKKREILESQRDIDARQHTNPT